MTFKTSLEYSVTPVLETQYTQGGGVAQMVERSLSMREVPGSIPGASRYFYTLFYPSKILPKVLHRPGIEPGPPAWQASILPLNQRCHIENCCIFSHYNLKWNRMKTQKMFAVGRIRTYAPRGKLISSQSP